MLHKTFDLIESKSDAQAGTFEATVAVFNNVDRGGDRIMPGAFTKTLKDWQASGDPIPVILSHQWDNPMAHIGVVEAAKETPQGLWVKGRLDVADNEVAKQVHRLMSRRSLKEFSFGYDVPTGGEKRAKDGANELHQIDLAEVGPTLKGMNPATELHGVKSALGVKQLTSVTRDLLIGAGRDRFGAANTCVYVDDFDTTAGTVVYLISGDTMERYVRVTYSIAADNTVTLGADETEVVRMTSYQPKSAGPARSRADLETELQEVKARLEDLTKKADATVREPKARSVDPLRARADALALEHASDGLSLNKPPQPAKTTPVREPEFSLRDLKARMREEMLTALSGETP